MFKETEICNSTAKSNHFYELSDSKHLNMVLLPLIVSRLSSYSYLFFLEVDGAHTGLPTITVGVHAYLHLKYVYVCGFVKP